MTTRLAVALMAAVLLLYIAVTAQLAYLMLTSGTPVAIAMGAVLVVIPIVAAWGLIRELWFGVRAERVGRRLQAEGGLPEDEVATHPSGRVVREDADALFGDYRDQVQQHPDDWRAWYRLGLVYDAAGDRKRARQAIRRSLTLEASDRPAS
ncbi:tetratricopeptide repeat protein [Microbacterium luticocti]|uniref:tetratricopeptide repeat protein n=1 Tax=Microbacterium luticocti TaxID=451764 RepID=UPI00048B14D6|nr:tetratricopeptide repeat protein [Microbacterium luticocti]